MPKKTTYFLFQSDYYFFIIWLENLDDDELSSQQIVNFFSHQKVEDTIIFGDHERDDQFFKITRISIIYQVMNEILTIGLLRIYT